MPAFTKALANEYQRLFYSAQIKPSAYVEVDNVVSRIVAQTERYAAIERQTTTPWYMIACIHLLECSLDFTKHLHNGDALRARTINVPRGRPKTGAPPFTFEQSAIDALTYEGLTTLPSGVDSWSIAYVLYKLEAYNGFGYRAYGINTPYLWSKTQHYTRGKFVRDGVFDSRAVSAQLGIACVLRRMAERELITSATIAPATKSADGSVRYGDTGAAVLLLQRVLNATPGILLREDGVAGPRTSDAFMRVYHVYLPGDPRAV